MGLKVHVDGLFTYHVVGWRRIPPNRVEGKLFSYLYIYIYMCVCVCVYNNQKMNKERIQFIL